MENARKAFESTF